MIKGLARSRDAASPWMLLASACLHGAFVLAMVAFSLHVARPHKTVKGDVGPVTLPVTLVELPSGPPAIERLKQGPIAETNVTSHEIMTRAERPAEPIHERRATVQERTSKAPKESISISKRNRPARRVVEPKQKKKPDDTVKKKEEKPDAIIEKRLAAIRKNLEKRKGQDPQFQSPTGAPQSNRSPATGGGMQGSDTLYRQLAEWLGRVRSRINDRWSVFTDNREIDRVTVIGVKIADDGRLLGASVDESSGDEMFDRSAIRAVFQAAPFPPIPAEVSEKIQRAGGLALRFTPRGMQ